MGEKEYNEIVPHRNSFFMSTKTPPFLVDSATHYLFCDDPEKDYILSFL
jgi:hypothetical protein